MRDTETSQVFICLFSCDREDAARGLVNALLVLGLLPELHEPEAPEQRWVVAAPAELVPTEANLADLRTAMVEAAQRSGATFEDCSPEA